MTLISILSPTEEVSDPFTSSTQTMLACGASGLHQVTEAADFNASWLNMTSPLEKEHSSVYSKGKVNRDRKPSEGHIWHSGLPFCFAA